MGVLSANLDRPFSIYKERDLSVLNFQAFGTSCKVKFSPLDSINHEFVSGEIVSWVSHFETRYSRYIPDSWLSLINESAGIKPVKLQEKDQQIFNAAAFTYFQSNHAIDPSCLPLTALWQEAKEKNQLPQEDEISEAKELVNWQNVQISEDEIFLPKHGMGLDFGGFGKEFAVDQVSEKLKSLSCKNYLIDFGGDIFAAGYSSEDSRWKVGIEAPEEREKPAFVLTLSNQALATSGNYRKYFDLKGNRYGHTIDNRTGYPTIHSELSASVISPSCLKSGIISTSCLMSGKHQGLRIVDSEWSVEGCIQSFDSPLLSNRFTDYIYNETQI
jgi:thiamine biosynthesis lipoprotein